MDFVDEGDSVLVTVEDAEGKSTRYRAKYLVAADGGKTIGPKIGVVMHGPTGKLCPRSKCENYELNLCAGVADMVSTHFSADLSQYWNDTWFACHFINGDGSTVLESGALVPMGPTWGRKSEEWVCHFGFDVNDKERFNESKLVPRIRALLKIPDLELKVHTINHWIIERVLANKFQEGRIFIAGDAAHRHPPSTGLGLNTAIEDANNLAWKISWALKGIANPSVLESYDSERRAVGKRNCDWGLFTFANTSVINASIGLVKGDTEGNKAKFEALFEDSESGRTFLAQTRRITESQDIEFSAHDLELGFRYDNGFHIADGTQPLPQDPLGQIYVPTTRPGHRLPHAWLEDKVGAIISTHDLVGHQGAMALITDAHGDAWISALSNMTNKQDLEVHTAQIGHNCQYIDRDDNWEKNKEIREGGAVLIRPDNFIVWRSSGPSKRDGKELIEAIHALVSRENVVTNGHTTNGLSGHATINGNGGMSF